VFQKVATFKLFVTLSNLNRFSKCLQRLKRMKFATKPMRQYPPHLRHVATLLGKLKIQFLSDIQQIWKKIQTHCILSAPIVIHLCVQMCMLSVFMCFYQNLALVADYHVDCWQTLLWRLLRRISSATNSL